MPIFRRSPFVHRKVDTSPLEQDVTLPLFGLNSRLRGEISGVNTTSGSVTEVVNLSGTRSRGRTGAPSIVTTGTGAAPFYFGDFSTYSDDAALHAKAGTTTTGNVHAEFGVGMRYDYQPNPTRCGDQTLSSTVSLPTGTRDVWIRFDMRFSNNYTPVNPNCTSPAPGHKLILSWLNNNSIQGGHTRFDWRLREASFDNHASVPGFPQHDVVPLNVVQDPMGMAFLLDGGWHTIEMRLALVGDNRATFQMKFDGVVQQNYDTQTATGLTGKWLKDINIGANRNLGATELMHIWWDNFEVWLQDPGDMVFPAPTVY